LKSGNACYHSVQNHLSFGFISKYTYIKIKIYKIIIMPVVLYRCKTWSLTLREEQRLRVFQNRAVRRIFGPKRDEVTEQWGKLHNEELNDLYFSLNIIRVINSRRMRWAEHVARMGEEELCIECFGGKPEGKNHLEEPGVDGRIILRWIFRKWNEEAWTGLIKLRIGRGGGNL